MTAPVFLSLSTIGAGAALDRAPWWWWIRRMLPRGAPASWMPRREDQPVQPVGPSAAGLAILRAEFVSGEMT